MVGRGLPQESDPLLQGVDLTGFNDNWWVGLSLFHTLFALEHNAICDRLHEAFPDWEEERLFQTARLINTALIAKIHTLEWTPAILGHPTLQIGMRANWWGILTERLTKVLGRVKTLPGIQEEISGIPGSMKDHGSAPYAMTEEFVTVYRMHPLIPDDYRLYSLQTDELLDEVAFNDIQGNQTRPFMARINMEDILYSFGVSHPGEISLKNFPRALQKFTRITDCDGKIQNELLDLGTVDILRDRERAIPRYNEFRKLLWRLPIRSFKRLVGLPILFPKFLGLTIREKKEREDLAKELKAVYSTVGNLDAMIGLLGEKKPKGFGFSDTAFRIFILMASRRLKSDRFYTEGYNPEVYTEIGYQWINSNGLKTVLERHFPALTVATANVDNPFSPWNRVERPIPEPTYPEIEWFDAKAISAAGIGGAVIGGGAAFNSMVNQWGMTFLESLGKLLQVTNPETVALSHLGKLLSAVLGWGTVGAALAVSFLAVFHIHNDRRERQITPRGRAAISSLFAVMGSAMVAWLMNKGGTSPLGSLGPVLSLWVGGGIGWTIGVALVKYGPFFRPPKLSDGWDRSSPILDRIFGALFAGVFGAVVGWIIGVGIYLVQINVLSKILEGLNSANVYWICAGTALGAFLGLIDRGRIGMVVGAVIGAVLGFVVFLVSLLVYYGVSLSKMLDALFSSPAVCGLMIGALIGAILIVLSEHFRWRVRRRFWSVLVWLKFKFNRELKINSPENIGNDINPIRLRERFPNIPVPDAPAGGKNIIIADHVPDDERSWPKELFYKIQIRFYSWFSAMQPGLPAIHKDPQKALAQAYRRGRRKLFDPPELPPEYEGSPDFGNLAVRGPYSCYLRQVKDGKDAGNFEWNLLELNDYGEKDYHKGLYKLGVRVLFQKVPEHSRDKPIGISYRLRPYEIDTELGITHPGDKCWELSKKIVMCSLTTHMSLVRHFNWVHLATGEPLAIATRNCLPPNHPLCRLLWPHIFGTQQSNAIVTPGQMVEGGDFDSIFSFTHGGMCNLFAKTFNDSFLRVNDPEIDGDIRGILNEGFEIPSQDNLVKLFGVFEGHVRKYVEHYYDSDAKIATDPKIIIWLEELEKLIPNGIGDVVPLSNVTRDGVIRLIARFIYLVTVQHEMVGTFLWNYQLWTHRQPVRVYKDGNREPLDIYERLVNANFNLNVTRAKLMADYRDVALDETGRAIIKDFQAALSNLQQNMEDEVWAVWKIYPEILEVNINA